MNILDYLSKKQVVIFFVVIGIIQILLFALPFATYFYFPERGSWLDDIYWPIAIFEMLTVPVTVFILSLYGVNRIKSKWISRGAFTLGYILPLVIVMLTGGDPDAIDHIYGWVIFGPPLIIFVPVARLFGIIGMGRAAVAYSFAIVGLVVAPLFWGLMFGVIHGLAREIKKKYISK
ncbi:MAG: hypothetical protein WC480_02270 [Patescibacteria group bacterium]